jgi:AcrR family transcriptional regulator
MTHRRNIESMPRGERSQSTTPTSTGHARERILAAAERCIDRHGIRKTTMDDIASEAGLARPSVYRYFADREDLLIELIARRARELSRQAHKAISRRDSLPEQIIAGVLYVADHARRDNLTRLVIDPEATSLGKRMNASGTLGMIRADLFDPYLDTAVANNELAPGLPRADIHMWLGNLGRMVMRGLEDGEGDLTRYRSLLRRFVAPAFTVSHTS